MSKERSRPMSDPDQELDADPGEVEPTDNSTGAPVDLDRVREVEQADDDDSG
jgi:hypothetical protein